MNKLSARLAVRNMNLMNRLSYFPPTVFNYLFYLIFRITALDPAFPGFHRKDIKSLNRDDADFVDVIHTDGGYFGEPGPTGTVDFFPNSGHAPQPGCLNTPVLIRKF